MKKLLTILALFVVTLSVAQKKKILSLAGEWKFTIGDREEFAQMGYDDRNWESIKVPAPWENEGFANYNGYAWYRIHFDGSDLKGFKNLIINLGYIDDVHEAYLNGKLLGFKGSFPPNFYTTYDALNEYALPESMLNRDGDNVIAIKVYDLVHDGGIVSGRNIGIWFEPRMPDDFLSLEGVWKFTTKRKSNWEDPRMNDEDWDNIVVPSYLKSKYIKNSRGFSFYRKEFYLPENLKGKDLYLILGMIDDFDYTYLNGEIIGRTKDFLPFGESNSWQELRIYKIPKEKLNQDGPNIIAVQVEDIGIDAGIYKGPIGIASQILSKNLYKR